MDLEAMLSQRKKTNRRTKNSEEKTVRRAEKQQRRAKVSDEGFHDAGETKYECEEGGDVKGSTAVEGMEMEGQEQEVKDSEDSAARNSMETVHEEGDTMEPTNTACEDMTGIEQQFGTAVMHDLPFRPTLVSGHAPAADITPAMPKEPENKPISEHDLGLLKQFGALKIEPPSKGGVRPPSRMHALEMEVKALQAKIRDLEKEIAQKNDLNNELTAITEDLTEELRRRDQSDEAYV